MRQQGTGAEIRLLGSKSSGAQPVCLASWLGSGPDPVPVAEPHPATWRGQEAAQPQCSYERKGLTQPCKGARPGPDTAAQGERAARQLTCPLSLRGPAWLLRRDRPSPPGSARQRAVTSPSPAELAALQLPRQPAPRACALPDCRLRTPSSAS